MRKILLCMLPVIVLGSCLKKAKDELGNLKAVKWSGTYAAPVLNAELRLKDAVEIVGGLIGLHPYNSGTIYLEFKDKYIAKTADEIVPLTDQSFNYAGALTSGEKSALTGSGTVTVNHNISFTYATPGNETDSLWLSDGTLTFNFYNDYAHPGTATVTFPGIKTNGTALSFTFSFSANQQNIQITKPLNMAHWNLSNGGSGYNHAEGNISIQFNNSGSGFSGSDQFKTTVSLSNLTFGRFYGYVGNNNLMSASDSIELVIFSKSLKTGSFKFNDPRFKFRTVNTTGIPFSLNTNTIYGTTDGSTTLLTGFPSTRNFAGLNIGQENGSISDSVVMNSSNSNIVSVIDAKPHYMAYKFNLTANPNGKTSRNFLTSTSKIRIDVLTELPFTGNAVNMVLDDTTDFDLGLGKEKDYIDWITLRLDITNEIPAEIGLQAYFMDTFNNVLDSLIKPARKFMNAAPVDAGGNVISASHDNYDITMDRVGIARIADAKKVRIKATVNTTKVAGNPVDIKITKDQKVILKLGIHAKASINEKL